MHINILVANTHLHQEAKLKKEEFLDKLSHVEALRASHEYLHKYEINYYLENLEDIKKIEVLHEIINTGDFSNWYDSAIHPFILSIPPSVYEWFSTTKLSIVKKQMLFWFAAFYSANDKKDVVKSQTSPVIFAELQKLIHEYDLEKYYEFNIDHNESRKIELMGLSGSQAFEEIAIRESQWLKTHFTETEIKEDYIKKLLSIDNNIPEILKTPYILGNVHDSTWRGAWGQVIRDPFINEIHVGYLRRDDWRRIITQTEGNQEIFDTNSKKKNYLPFKDDMQRAESRKDYYEIWKYLYMRHDSTKNYVYDIYFEKVNKKYKREQIDDKLKEKIWKRDEGKCAFCESVEKLEFDHIVPVCEGGKSTFRNLRLLCESCNRQRKKKFDINIITEKCEINI